MKKYIKKHRGTNIKIDLDFLGKGGVIIKPNGLISILRPYNTCRLDKIIINSLLKFVGKEYEIVEEEKFSEGLVYHTNLNSETLFHYDPKTKVEIKVNKEDLDSIVDFEGVNKNDGTRLLFCRKQSFSLRKKLLNICLKCYGPKSKITAIKKFDEEYMIVGTNIPSHMVEGEKPVFSLF